MKKGKYQVQVRKTDGTVVETVNVALRAEAIGNFNPIFCTYKGDDRHLVKSDEGDLSDPFRRTEQHLDTLHIIIP